MLNSIVTCNTILKRSSPVLNSHNNFQKGKALFIQKVKIPKFFFRTLGPRPLNFAIICDFQDFAILKALYILIGYFKMILQFWVELREFFQNIYSFIYVTSSSTKILEINNENISLKSKFSFFFLSSYVKVLCYLQFLKNTKYVRTALKHFK